jgi:hypothetical protein
MLMSYIFRIRLYREMLDAETARSTKTNSTPSASRTRKIRPRTLTSHLPDLQVPSNVGQ